MSDTTIPGWKNTLLGSEITLNMGQSPPSNTYNTERKGLPFFQGKADFGVKYPVASVWCDSPQKTADQGSILFSVRAPVGEININTEKSCIGRGLAAIKANQMSNVYLFYLLDFKKIDFHRLAQGSTFEAINGSQLKEVEVCLPPKREQQKIAEILTSVDEVIENTQSQINKLEDLKKATINELLTKGIGHTEFKATEIGRIPRSWDIVKFDNVVDLSVGYAFKSSLFNTCGIRLLRGENVGYGQLNWDSVENINERFVEDYKNYLLKNGDIVIGMDRTFTKSGVKISKVQNKDLPCLLVQRVGKFITQFFTSDFLWHLLRSDFYLRQLIVQQKGMDIPHLSKNDILSPIVPLVPKSEQLLMTKVLDEIDKRIENLKIKDKKTANLKQSLMQDLLTGKVRVTVN